LVLLPRLIRGELKESATEIIFFGTLLLGAWRIGVIVCNNVPAELQGLEGQWLRKIDDRKLAKLICWKLVTLGAAGTWLLLFWYVGGLLVVSYHRSPALPAFGDGV
jgi:hypothetical protein